MLELEPGVIGWAWITFGVLLFLLYKFAWKPILSIIDKREKTIQDSLDNAEKAHTEAQSLLEKHEQMIKDAEEEAQKLIKENREAAEKSRQEIIQQARASAETMVQKAKDEIEKEKETALHTLRAEVADLAISATKKIIGETIDEAKQRALVDEFIQKMPKSAKH
jgi:F-type H+-transporting ATPase subunit b